VLNSHIRKTFASYPRQFWLMFCGMTISTVGASMIWPCLMIYVSEKLDLPRTTVAFLMTINSVAGLCSSFLAGPIIDRVGRKGVMVFSLAANGYIAFQDVDETSVNNLVPSLPTHFAVPRLSFLFANLAPNISGDIWARLLDNRIVITFQGIPEAEVIADPPARKPNTVQVELFYSGHIRLTYLDCAVDNAVVGLSDGQGMPRDPALLFSGVHHVQIPSDLSEFPNGVTALTIEPIALQQVISGEEISFVAKTSVPDGWTLSSLSAEWNGPTESASSTTQAPFAADRDEYGHLTGTGTFLWQTGLLDYGSYLVRITATAVKDTCDPETSCSVTAYQDVSLAVGSTEPLDRKSVV
jgi:hypothetical protein